MATRFQQALQQAEKSRDPSIIAGLFHEGARLTNLGGDHGTDATKFWQIYLEQFSGIRSEFVAEVTSEGSAALEWRSRGKLADGRPVDYRGLSLIDFNEDGVTSFRAYTTARFSCVMVWRNRLSSLESTR